MREWNILKIKQEVIQHKQQNWDHNNGVALAQSGKYMVLMLTHHNVLLSSGIANNDQQQLTEVQLVS